MKADTTKFTEECGLAVFGGKLRFQEPLHFDRPNLATAR
jgi:hypothetical protein